MFPAFLLFFCEGMAYGLTPVSMRVGGQAELIETGKSGFLIELDLADEDSMARHFAQVCFDLVTQPNLLRARRSHHSSASKRFSEGKMIASLLSHFAGALRDRMTSLAQQLPWCASTRSCCARCRRVSRRRTL